MELFDDKNNWGQSKVKVGRSWKLDELRIKSNSDLHKLWFVLLKERNMLLTMEHECKEQTELFPNPERIHKVEKSMSNLETVVREGNEAYYKLETGQTGERPVCMRKGVLGLMYRYRMAEHLIPQFMNKKW
jgi:large subunit ribosomal protein L47